jgi:hypothetical protein
MGNCFVVTATGTPADDYKTHQNTGAPNYDVDHGLLRSATADGASAVGFDLDTDNSLVTAGAKLLSLKNGASEKFGVDKDGRIIVVDAGSLPAAGAAYEGFIALVYDNTRNRDRTYICVKYYPEHQHVTPPVPTYEWKEFSLDWINETQCYAETFNPFVPLAYVPLVATPGSHVPIPLPPTPPTPPAATSP